MLKKLPREIFAEDVETKVIRYSPEKRFEIIKENGIYVVSGREVEKHLAMTDFDNEDSLQRFQRIMKVIGVEDELKKQGAINGDTVRIKEMEFEFQDG